MKVTRQQAALLALLLDADGATVSFADLGDVVGAYGVNVSSVVRGYTERLSQQGVLCVDVVKRRGCRMVGLPPDEILEDVLTMLDVIRRDGFALAQTWKRAS